MNVVILGGDGFIGSHLRNAHLMLGDNVHIVDINLYRSRQDSNEYNYTNIDFAKDNQTSLKIKTDYVFDTKPDMVYNCVAVATPSYYVSNPVDTFNLDFTVNKEIIDMLHYRGFPFIHFSSSEVYGKNWTEPYTEESDSILGSASKNRWIYATSKLLLDQYILSSKIDCCVLRPFNFIGHDIDWLPDLHNAISKDKTWIPRVPACFLNSLFMKKPMIIVNPGTQSRCYTHIDDAVLGILSVVDNWSKCSGEIINIGNPNNEINIETLAKKMAVEWKNIMGEGAKRPKHINGTKLYGKGYEDSNRRLFSDKKMKKLTGWEANMGINETIRTTVKDAIEVFRSHEDNSIRSR